MRSEDKKRRKEAKEAEIKSEGKKRKQEVKKENGR
jgi:hypothetical protein